MGAVRALPGSYGIGRLFNKVRDAVIVADVTSGCIVLWNKAAERLFGFTENEAFGGPIEIIIPERYRERHRAGMERYRRTRHGTIIDSDHAVEIQALHKDGHEIPVELTLSPIEEAEIAGDVVMAIVRDISDRLERARLERQHLEELKRIDRLKTEFLGVLSHELRTPINAITGFGSILQDEIAGRLNDAQHGYLEQLMAGADHLLTLVNDLLDMAQIQAGRVMLQTEPMNLCTAVRDVIEELEPEARSKAIAVEHGCGDDLPAVAADPQRVAQVLRHLVGNAIKFAPPGGWVKVGASRDDGAVLVTVEDNGPGIAEADFEKLFRPFSQLDMSMTRAAGGSGLGLSISKALVESHGGTIGVNSRPGQGSRFWFRLPLGPETTALSEGPTG